MSRDWWRHPHVSTKLEWARAEQLGLDTGERAVWGGTFSSFSKINSEASERFYLTLSLAWHSSFQWMQCRAATGTSLVINCALKWLGLTCLNGKLVKCVYVHETCLCEKEGDKFRINSSGCAKYAYLKSISFQIGPCLWSAGLLIVSGIC